MKIIFEFLIDLLQHVLRRKIKRTVKRPINRAVDNFIWPDGSKSNEPAQFVIACPFCQKTYTYRNKYVCPYCGATTPQSFID